LSYDEYGMKPLCPRITWWTVIVGSLMLCVQTAYFITGLIFVPVVFGPVLLHLWFSRMWKSRYSDWILSAASLIFAVWFLFVYLDVFAFHPGPQSPVALLLIGIYALPILALFWAGAWFMRNKDETR
jgi:hypothetical protein